MKRPYVTVILRWLYIRYECTTTRMRFSRYNYAKCQARGKTMTGTGTYDRHPQVRLHPVVEVLFAIDAVERRRTYI